MAHLGLKIRSTLALSLLVAVGGGSLTGCDYLKKKAGEKLEAELKKDLDEKLSDKDKKGDKKDGDKADDKADGEMWVEQITGSKKKMVRTKLDDGDMKGFSIMAPEGAKVGKSLGGKGAEVSEQAYGYVVWVTEDPTATMDHMRTAAKAWHKDAKLENEDANSFIVAGKGLDDDAVYYYKGIFKANGKTYRCETDTSTAPSKKEHALAIDKACESLELDGKSIGTGGTAAPAEEKVAEEKKDEPAKEEPKAEKPAETKPAVAVNTPPTPPTPPKPTATTTAPPPPKETAKPAAPPPPPPPAKEKTKVARPKK